MTNTLTAARAWARAFLTLFSLTICAHLARAADADTGVIEGRVLNATTGNYVSKARVSVAGTNLEVLTNDYGEYRIANVPSGTAQVVVRFAGRAPKSTSVTVTPDATVTHNVELSDNDAITLNEFVVEAERYNTAQEIAINEERYSVNIKNVVSADAFGEIPSGNIGEFVKFLPGIELAYGGTYTAPTDAMGISVRGFGPQDTAIYIDGVPVSSASQGSLTNQIELDMLSINNASRVELIKVPTPDMPMNSVGGQINLISKSAFEYAKPTFLWKAYVTVNSENLNPFERVPGPRAEKVYAGQPGFELSYIRPVNEKLGFTITASTFSQFSENRRLRPEWGTSNVRADLRPFGGANNTDLTNAIGPASLANPYLTRVSLTDAPRTSRSYSASLKGDWKPFDGLTLSGGYQISTYESADAARRIQFRIQRPMSWDATHTISYPYLPSSQSANNAAFNPNSSLEMNIDSRDKEGITHTGSLRAIYRRGGWDVFALASASTSRASFKDFENGHFSTVDLEAEVGQIKFENISGGVPGTVTVFDRSGNELDYTKLENWEPEIRGRSGLAESMDDVFNYKLDVLRQLDFLPWDNIRLGVKAGYLREEKLKKKWGRGTNYRESYVGPDLTTEDYLDTTYFGQDPGFGFAPQEWISTYRLYDIYAANPSDFAVTVGDARENWNSYVGQNKNLKETTDAWYGMLEGDTKLWNRRLSFVAGVRAENASRVGRTPKIDGRWNFIKNADGTLYRNPGLLGGSGLVRIDQTSSALFAQNDTGNALRADLSSKGIAFPTSVIANNTLESQMLQRLALQEVRGESKGKPSPSINFAYDLTSKLSLKVAWSRTFGRIPLEDASSGGVVGLLTSGNNFTFTEQEDPTRLPRGTIKVSNPNLLPEISNNWDFALNYYSDFGGKFGVSYYVKNIENFSDDITTPSGTPEFNAIMTSLELDPADYEDWEITTAANGIGTGKVQGYEFEAYHDLRILPFLGEWGRRISVFGTYSHSKRSENNTTRISARPAATDLATAGINISSERLTLSLRSTWRDVTFVTGRGNFTINGTTYQLGEFDPATTRVDANLEYRFSPRYALYVSGRDIFAEGLNKLRFDQGGIYPTYAHMDDIREFGVQWTIGVKGRF